MRKLSLFLFLLLVGFSCQGTPLLADISLAKIFSDHMVLQRNSTVRIWGTGEAGEKLDIKFGDQATTATVDPRGQWSTAVKTGDAGGPYQIEVAAESGEPRIVISDVLVGEVWLCSGQSNMAWTVAKSLNPEEEIDAAKSFPNIRLFTAERHVSATPNGDFNKASPWECCSQESVKDFSAVAYFFGRELSKKLDGIPIGLINSSWGGTRCEAWTSRAALEEVEELRPLLKHWDENDDPTNRHRPSNLYNAMISPLAGIPIRGVIWYQGEANVGRGHQYATLFPTMIKNWRKELGKGEDFPFLFVQLAPFRYKGKSPEALAEIWDAQLSTYKNVSNTGIAVTTDIGNILNIHPKNKQEVGRRLALWALKSTYDPMLKPEDKVKVSSGPIFESISINKNELRATFKNADGGLVVRGGGSPSCFSICGKDNVFHPAEARIDGAAVVLSSPEVDSPVAVRFCWNDSSEPNLFNQQDLPASPFRSDTFDLQSKEVHY